METRDGFVPWCVRSFRPHRLAVLIVALIVTAAGRRQAQAVLSQSSYYSHDDLRLHFGLGPSAKADAIEVRWPSGQVDVLKDVEGRRVVTIKEGVAALVPVVDVRPPA